MISSCSKLHLIFIYGNSINLIEYSFVLLIYSLLFVVKCQIQTKWIIIVYASFNKMH